MVENQQEEVQSENEESGDGKNGGYSKRLN